MTTICIFINSKIKAHTGFAVFFDEETSNVMDNFPRHEASTEDT